MDYVDAKSFAWNVANALEGLDFVKRHTGAGPEVP